MNKTLRILIIGAMLLVAALAALPAGAQESAISATINRNEITTDDLLLLTVRLTVVRLSQPARPAAELDGFRIIGTSSSTQMTTINGDTSVATIFSVSPSAAAHRRSRHTRYHGDRQRPAVNRPNRSP